MSGRAVRAAILGSGRVAQIRARELHAHPSAELAVVGSEDRRRAESIAGLYGAAVSCEPLAVCVDPRVDAVIVCTTNERHAEYAEVALRGGKAVCVEYPLALSFADAERLVSIANERGTVLHVEHIDLLSPWFRTLEENLSRVGDVRAISWMDVSARKPGCGRDWVFDRRSGRTLFVHASILSRMIRLGGPVTHLRGAERFYGLAATGRFTGRTTQAGIEFENGALGSIWDGIGAAADGPSSLMTVCGSEGTLESSGRQKVWFRCGAQEPEELFVHRREGLFAQDTDSFLRQILHGEASYAPLPHVLAVMAAAEMLPDLQMNPAGESGGLVL